MNMTIAVKRVSAKPAANQLDLKQNGDWRSAQNRFQSTKSIASRMWGYLAEKYLSAVSFCLCSSLLSIFSVQGLFLTIML